MRIINYSPEYKNSLLELSLEWLNQYDLLEDADIEMVTHPERMIKGGGAVLLAQSADGQIVGMVMLENQGEHCEILKLSVTKLWQNQGAASKLMESILNIARKDGYKKAVLCTNHKLSAALHLYEKFGFQYVTYASNHFELSDISMELPL